MQDTDRHLEFRDKRCRVFSTFLGDFQTGYNGKPSSLEGPQVDVFVYPPGAGGRPFYTILTNGMSDRRMAFPEEVAPFRTEIIAYVSESRQQYLDWIYWAAQFPFIDKTYLDICHRIPWHEPLFKNSALSCMLFLDPIVKPDRELETQLKIENDPVKFLWWVPVSRDEYELARSKGTGALLDLFDAHEHPFILDENRKSYV